MDIQDVKDGVAKVVSSSAWKYVLGEDYVTTFDNKYGISLDNPYVTISGNTVTIKTGYAWNGLESKYFSDSKIISFALKAIKKLNEKLAENGLPEIWKATLLFDVFMQHREKFQGVALSLGLEFFSKYLIGAGISPMLVTILSSIVSTFIAKQ